MDKVWQQPFELAWQSLKAGSFPVGAVLHDPTGNVVFTGRNRSKENSAPPGRMAGTAIAHAEVDVLAQLGRGKYLDWTMYSTLQSCLFCLTGLRLAQVGRVVYAGPDPIWDPTAQMPAMLPELLSAKWPISEGPAAGFDGVWGALLTGLWYVGFKSEAVAEPTDLIPWPTVELARRCVAAGILDIATMEEAYRLAESLA
jgi:tRNA(Arg) A34 adenosine deaminase TadA